MHIIKANFNDFDQFNHFAVNWELDFKLLSKNNFKAFLDLYSNDSFQLGRTKLSGTIHQQGIVPKGFRTIVIPASFNTSFNWLHKDVKSDQLLIFPKDGTLESVSFNNFDVYVLSVREEELAFVLDSQDYINANKAFGRDEKYIFLEKDFLLDFWKKASYFLEFSMKNVLNPNKKSLLIEKTLADQLVLDCLQYIERSQDYGHKPLQRKRDIALKSAVKHIENMNGQPASVVDLCEVSKVSERTLEYAFLEKYQLTPLQYIKAYRLNKVKARLTNNKERKLLVSEIASHYGFHHMGQFAKDFKRHFGVNPSQIK